MTTIVEIRATDPLMSAVYALRREVFVLEQGVPEELEVDEHDNAAVHLAALSDGDVVGTLRCAMSTPRRSAGWLYLRIRGKKGSEGS